MIRAKAAAVALLVAVTACGDDGSGTGDAAVSTADASAATDAPLAVIDAATPRDGASTSDAAVVDAALADASPPADAPLPDAAAPDAMVDLVDHVHIYVSNTCVMSVSPTSFDVQPGQTLQLSYHNHSVDYPVDVWKSYGGGYLDLATGATWNETYVHCGLSSSYTEYADISTACSQFRLYINCL